MCSSDLLTGAGRETQAELGADRFPDHVAADLASAADWILSRDAAR